ncbi:hypothetical protein ACP6JB_004493 [Aspergillus fumigatus]
MAHDPDSSNADSSIVAILAWGFRQHPVAELVAGIPEMEGMQIARDERQKKENSFSTRHRSASLSSGVHRVPQTPRQMRRQKAGVFPVLGCPSALQLSPVAKGR